MSAYLETSRGWYLRVPTLLREVAFALIIAAIGVVIVTHVLPKPDDASAHLYRALLVARNATLWDNYWYGGDYPLASYSLLAYLPQRVIGPATLAALSVIATAGMFAWLVVKRWGYRAAWGSRIAALLVLGPLFTGGYAYAIGAAALLACLVALQYHRLVVAGLLGALTLGLSPLAFAFLGLILTAVWLEHRRFEPRTFVVAAWLGVLVIVQLAIGWLFPSEGVYPFLFSHLIAVLSLSVVGVAIARRRPDTHVIMWLLIVWAIGSIVLFAVPTPIGDNLVRLRYFLFPVLLIAVMRTSWRPRILVAVALAGSFAYGAVPDLSAAMFRTDARPTTPAFWQPAIAFLNQNETPDYRVEVVQTAGRWEAYWIPQAGFALVRGWFRQFDLVDNPVLYQKTITPREFQAWLRSRAVRYVLLPATPLDTDGAMAEATLLRSGTSGLTVVARTGDWTIYELPHATPLMTGPGTARITEQGHAALAGTVTEAGRYLLRIRWMPYWQLSGVVDCVAPGPNGQTIVRTAEPGGFALKAPERADLLVERIFDAPATDATCAS
jgi:hypothetical protein